MAFLALGSTNSKDTSTPTSAEPIPAKPIEIKTNDRESAGTKSPPIKPPIEKKMSAEVEQAFAERSSKYESQLAAWNDANESRNAAEAEESECTAKIKAIESEKPIPPTHEEREWTTIDGKHTTTAVLVATDSIEATLKKSDGKTVTVSKEKLIAVDRVYIQKAFEDMVAFRQKFPLWENAKRKLTEQLSAINARISAADIPKPLLPTKDEVALELAEEKKNKKEFEKIAKAEAKREEAEMKAEKTRIDAEEKAVASRKLAEEKALKAEEEYEQNGLVLLRKTVHGKQSEFGGEISGEVINRRKHKLSYAQIQFNLYDDSGAQVGTALANINGLEPGGKWKFEAHSLGTKFSTYKFSELTGF